MPAAADYLKKSRQTWPGRVQDEPGLQQPDVDPVMLLAGLLGPMALRSLVKPMAGALGAGAGAVSDLPMMQSGLKTGDPHALFAYEDMFGPGGSKREIFNVFGDPSNDLVKKVGWGSSVPRDMLQGIKVTGRQAKRF